MSMRRWEDNIRMDLKEISINTRNLNDAVQDRGYWRTLVNATLNLRVSEAMALINLLIGLSLCIYIFNTR